MVEAVDVDAVCRELGPGVVTSLEHVKQGLNIFAIARESAGHANDGDGHDLVWLKAVCLGHDDPVMRDVLQSDDEARLG